MNLCGAAANIYKLHDFDTSVIFAFRWAWGESGRLACYHNIQEDAVSVTDVESTVVDVDEV